MRLRRLDLTRYGHFTDHSLDFGAAVPGEPDLHVVYGANEAGKSTALSAWLDLLFGIETRSRYSFRHPYDTMRIGAVVETGAGPQEFVRIKRQQASLRDAADRALPEAALLGALGGLDRAAYRAMFCLDDDSLEAGGRSILESRGELGQLLFAASAGLAELGQTLERLKTEADQFHRPHGRGTALTQLKDRLATLRQERERLDTVASDHHRLAALRDDALASYETAKAEQLARRTAIERLQRQLAALPHLADWHDVRAQLEEFAGLPAPPAGWAGELPRLLRDDVQLATRVAGFDADIVKFRAQRDAIAVDAAAIELASRFAALNESRARDRTAELDLPTRRGELQAADGAIAAVLARLGRQGEPDPARLVLPARTAAKLDQLKNERSGIATRLALAQREHSMALQRLYEARQRAHEAGGSAGGEREARLRQLAAAASALRDSDHGSRHRTAERTAAAARVRLDKALAALHPWSGPAAALAATTPPDPSRMALWERTHERLRRGHDTLAEKLAALDDEIARLAAERTAMGAELGLITDHEAATLRTARDAAWAAHRGRLDAASADAFAAALRRDDAAMGARLDHQAEAARLRQLAQTLATATAERERVAGRARANDDASAALAAEIAGTVAANLPGLAGLSAPGELGAWLGRRAAALEIHGGIGLAEAEARAAAEDGARLIAALRDALAHSGVLPDPGAGPPAEAAALLAAAEAAQAEAAEAVALRRAVADAEAGVAERNQALHDARKADAAWSVAWHAACRACWFAELDPVPDPDEAAGLAATARELVPLLQKHRDLAARIAAMEADQTRFAGEIGELAARLALPPDEAPQSLADRVGGRIEAAREARTLRERAAGELATSEEQRRQLAAAQAAHAARKTEMLGFFGVATLDEVALRLRAVERRAELQRRAAAARAALAEAQGGPLDPTAEAALAALSADTLRAELQGLRGEAEAGDERLRELYARSEQSCERLAAIGGDDAVARLGQRRQTTLLEIEHAAGAYLRLRAGILATEMALSAYRERHRSAMMQRAAAAFATISRGAYRSLASRPERDSEVLIAIAADGGSKLAEDLSKGTRFQLYLALRAAGYTEFATAHHPVPFIADDIMETFDNLRAEETFRVLGEMARTGQVIYLTHHQHLCDIVATVLPQARLHSLAP